MDLIKDHKDNFRMYGLVPYNISPIQQGIQFGHAVQEYNNLVFDHLNNALSQSDVEGFEEWRKYGKTFIILNGGTTNSRIIDDLPFGSMNQNLIKLKEIGITTAEFYEPDLGEQLTAIVFLVPKEVYNKKEFPDFRDFVMSSDYTREYKDYIINCYYTKDSAITDYKEFDEIYNEWVKNVGGIKNVKLREFLSNFRLA
jgi:hypothetical protein